MADTRRFALADRDEAIADPEVVPARLCGRAAIEEHACAKEFLIELPRLVDVVYRQGDVVDKAAAEKRILRRGSASKIRAWQRRILSTRVGGRRSC